MVVHHQHDVRSSASSRPGPSLITLLESPTRTNDVAGGMLHRHRAVGVEQHPPDGHRVPWLQPGGGQRDKRSHWRFGSRSSADHPAGKGGDRAGGLGGRPGATANNDPEQADKGKGDKDSSLRDAPLIRPTERLDARRIGQAAQIWISYGFLGLLHGQYAAYLGEFSQ